MALLGRQTLFVAGGAAALVVVGCALSFNYTECNVDDDCAKLAVDGGAKLFCTADKLCVAGEPDDRLCPETVGTPAAGVLVIGVLTNRNDEADKAIENAVRLAVDEINMRQEGASQPPLVARMCNTAGDSEQALKAARRAVEYYGAVALIGPTASAAVVKVNQYIKERGVLVISPSATAVDISSLQDDGLVWRTAPSDALQAKVLAQKVRESLPPPTVVDSLNVVSVYGTGLATAFANEYSVLKGMGFKTAVTFKTAGEIPTALNALGRDGPSHAVVIADLPEVLAMVKMFGSQDGLKATQFFFADAAKDPGLFGNMGTTDESLLRRIRGTAPATPASPAFEGFRMRYNAAFKRDPIFTSWVGNAYDAAYLVAIAASATTGRVPTGKELASGLGRIRPTGTAVTVGPTSYLDALKQQAAGSLQLDGVSGPLAFDTSTGDLTFNPKAFEFWCIGKDMSGKLVFIGSTQSTAPPDMGMSDDAGAGDDAGMPPMMPGCLP